MFSLVFSVFMVLGAAAFIALPFFRRERFVAGEEPVSGSARLALERQKFEAYAAIKEAELDYRMGKLSEADFGAQREKFASRALEAIAVLQERVEPAATTGKRRRARYCSQCGEQVPPRAKFCGGCGTALKTIAA